MYWQNFLRAIGFRQSFRRTDANSWSGIVFAAMVGAVSGRYIFKEPLEEYWSEENRAKREKSLAEKTGDN